MLKNLSKISHYLSNLWMNISSNNWIVYQTLNIGIWSLFVSILFKIDQIVHPWPNIAVTYFHPSPGINEISKWRQMNKKIWYGLVWDLSFYETLWQSLINFQATSLPCSKLSPQLWQCLINFQACVFEQLSLVRGVIS